MFDLRRMNAESQIAYGLRIVLFVVTDHLVSLLKAETILDDPAYRLASPALGVGFLVAAVILMYMATTYTTEFRPAPGGNVCRERWGYPSVAQPPPQLPVTPTATLCRWSSAD